MKPSRLTSSSIIETLDVGVESECGQLDLVLMHKPGRELFRVTEDNKKYLLFDAVPNINDTHSSHDAFSDYLRVHGAGVLYLRDLLVETLQDNRQARQSLIHGIVFSFRSNHVHLHESVIDALYDWLRNRTPDQLAEDVIVGVAWSKTELGTSENSRILLRSNDSNEEFILPPLPNLLFTRDVFSIIEKNVFIWQMNKPARRNEPLILRTIFQYHPYLSTSGLKIIEWTTENDDVNHEYPTIEGGDIAYLGKGILLIGCGERTNTFGIEKLARTGLFRQIIAVMLPKSSQYMHLDTVLSSVGKHSFTLHSPLAEKMEVFTVEYRNDKATWTSYGHNIRQALRKLLHDPELIFYDAQDAETSILEQQEFRHNVLAVDDGHVMTYAGGDPLNGIIAAMTQNNVCRVGKIPPKGLAEGGGGAHCMTNALRRRAR